MFSLIKSSVGRNGKNQHEDVLNVQMRLNKWIVAGRLPKLPFLVMDGVCGPKTKQAIGAFQLRYVDIKNVDRRIDPNGKTLTHLMLNPFSPPPLRVSDPVYYDWLSSKKSGDLDDDIPYWEKRGMFWVGAGVKVGGGSTPLNGTDTILASLYNYEAPSNKFVVNTQTKRHISAGGGISASGVITMVTGIYHPQDLNKIQFGGVDWNLAVLGNWGTFAKWAVKAPQLAKLVQAARLSRFADVSSVAELISTLKGGITAHGISINDPTPAFISMDIPFAGMGMEISLYYGVTSFRILQMQLDE